jgi:3-oxoacyl-[acyl-carrier protein] reductase
MPTDKPDRFLVTGAASGIGQRVADLLLSRGHRVLATDIDRDGLEAHARSWPAGRVAIARLDVTDAAAWVAVLDRARELWGGLDVLYNVAGYLAPGWAAEVRLEDVARHLDINVKGVMYGTRLAAERMLARGRGHIVNIGSMAAYAPIPGLSLYSASKFAVRAFSIAAGIELRGRGVAVTVVCPDAVATPMLDKQKDYEEAAMTFTAPRVLTAGEVAEVLVGEVLERRPLEVALPRSRKWLARVADLVPEVALWAKPLFEKQGRARQRARR